VASGLQPNFDGSGRDVYDTPNRAPPRTTARGLSNAGKILGIGK
jgi:hypothetical protein